MEQPNINQPEVSDQYEFSDVKAAYARLIYDTIRDYQGARNERDFSAANWILEDLHGLIIGWLGGEYDEKIKDFLEDVERIKESYGIEDDNEAFNMYTYKRFLVTKFHILCKIMSEVGILHGRSTVDQITQLSENDLIKIHFDEQVSKDSNVFCFIQGKTGRGKSFAGLSLSEKIDPDFDANTQIVFYKDDFAKLIKKAQGIDTDDNTPKLKAGQVILWDEVGQNMHSQKWMDDTIRYISNNLETMRALRIHVIFTAPMMEFFEGRSRKLLHMRINMQEPKRKKYWGVPQVPEQLIYKRDDPVRWIPLKVRNKTLSKIYFGLPSKKVREIYKEKKAEFNKKVAKNEKYENQEEEPLLDINSMFGIKK